MSVDQNTMRDALLDAGAVVPQGLIDGHGRPAGRRFSVYRNNVVGGLITALQTSFPATEKIVGTEKFRAVAGTYARRSPPDSPMMMYYGEGFPAFLQSFEPVAHLAYLGDVARLEQARRDAYHAADTTPAEAQILATLSPDQLAATRFILAPTVRLIRSDWPIHAIWAFNMVEGASKPVAQAQNVLITRPDFDPEMHVIDTATFAFLSGLRAGQTLAEAAESAAKEFDLGTALGLLLQTGAIHKITPGGPA